MNSVELVRFVTILDELIVEQEGSTPLSRNLILQSLMETVGTDHVMVRTVADLLRQSDHWL